MAGVDLEAIHRALATQIKQHVDADTTVYPFPMGQRVMPCITVYPDQEYANYFDSFGPNGTVTLNLRIKIEVDAAEGESMGMKMCQYLGIGIGNTSSVVDAINTGRNSGTTGTTGALGGLADDCVALTSEWADPDTEPGVGWIPVRVIATKIGAQT